MFSSAARLSNAESQLSAIRALRGESGAVNNVAVVGSSFGDLPSRILIEAANCSRAASILLLRHARRFGGAPLSRIATKPFPSTTLNAWRNAEVMILEENESFMASG